MNNETKRTVYKCGFKNLNQNTNEVNLANYKNNKT